MLNWLSRFVCRHQWSDEVDRTQTCQKCNLIIPVKCVHLFQPYKQASWCIFVNRCEKCGEFDSFNAIYGE